MHHKYLARAVPAPKPLDREFAAGERPQSGHLVSTLRERPQPFPGGAFPRRVLTSVARRFRRPSFSAVHRRRCSSSVVAFVLSAFLIAAVWRLAAFTTCCHRHARPFFVLAFHGATPMVNVLKRSVLLSTPALAFAAIAIGAQQPATATPQPGSAAFAPNVGQDAPEFTLPGATRF